MKVKKKLAPTPGSPVTKIEKVAIVLHVHLPLEYLATCLSNLSQRAGESDVSFLQRKLEDKKQKRVRSILFQQGSPSPPSSRAFFFSVAM
jgi:hypothetical protein